MKIEFRTIAIVHLVLSYLIIAGLAWLAQLFFPSSSYLWLLILGPVVLYFLHRGKVKLEMGRGRLKIGWVKKPLINFQTDREIDLDDIIRWKYERAFRGPDNFILILRNGERIQIRPAMFSMRDLETELFKTFSEKMRAHHADTPKERLQELLINSGYLKVLNRKLRLLTICIKVAIALGLISLSAMIFTEGEVQDMLSASFLFFFVLTFLVLLYSKYLKMEKEHTIAAE